MGFLTLDPELDEGSVKFTGDEEVDEEKAILYVIDGLCDRLDTGDAVRIPTLAHTAGY